MYMQLKIFFSRIFGYGTPLHAVTREQNLSCKQNLWFVCVICHVFCLSPHPQNMSTQVDLDHKEGKEGEKKGFNLFEVPLCVLLNEI